MTLTIDLEKDKPPLGDLVEQTLSGTEVVLTKGDRPVAKLVAIAEKPIRQFGSAKGSSTLRRILTIPSKISAS